MAEYDTSIEEPEMPEQTTEEKPAPEDDQTQVAKKLTDKNFFNFAQVSAKEANSSLQEYLADTDPRKVLELAEKYENEIAPSIEKYKKFFSQVFRSELKVVPGSEANKASGEVEKYLVEIAAKGEAKFDELTAKMAKFEELNEAADALTARLEAKFSTSDAETLEKRSQPRIEAMLKSAEDMLKSNEAIYNEEKVKLGKGLRIDKRIRNKLFKTNFRTDAEVAEENKYKKAEKYLNEQIETFRASIEDIKDSIPKKEEFEKDIAATKEELISELGPMKEVRKMLFEAARTVIDSGKFNPDQAAGTFNTMEKPWGSGEKGFDDNEAEYTDYKNEVTRLMTEVYTKVVETQMKSAEQSINPTKLQEFDKFVAANVDNPEAKDMIIKVVDDALINNTPDPNSPKAAHLTLMKKRLLSHNA